QAAITVVAPAECPALQMDRTGMNVSRAHKAESKLAGNWHRCRVLAERTVSQLPPRVAAPAVDLVLSSDTTAVVESGADHLEVQTTLNGDWTGAKRGVDRAIAELANAIRPPAV